MRTLITGGTLVTATGPWTADVLVEDERSSASPPPAAWLDR
jgi:hypothetical protein